MREDADLSRQDLRVLFWIVGCRTGASYDEILEHEGNRNRSASSVEAIRESLARLESRQLISLDGERFRADSKLQVAFLNECRNCRDTMEEVAILRRIIPTMDHRT